MLFSNGGFSWCFKSYTEITSYMVANDSNMQNYFKITLPYRNIREHARILFCVQIVERLENCLIILFHTQTKSADIFLGLFALSENYKFISLLMLTKSKVSD